LQLCQIFLDERTLMPSYASSARKRGQLNSSPGIEEALAARCAQGAT
jgi:hypothetical protein